VFIGGTRSPLTRRNGPRRHRAPGFDPSSALTARSDAADKVEESRRALSTARSRAEAAADALKAIEKGRPI
jgi:hypothetical protein